MIDFEKIVTDEAITKKFTKMPAAEDPGKKKRSDELKTEASKNKKTKKTDLLKEDKKEPESDHKIYTTRPLEPEIQKVKPIKESILMTCPFCGERRKARGISQHVQLKHNIPGVSIQDLEDIKKGSKTLEALVDEKFNGKGKATIANVSPDILKKDLPSRGELEGREKVKDQKELENQEKVKNQEEIEKSGNGLVVLISVLILGITTFIFGKYETFDSFKEAIEKLISGAKNKSPGKMSFGQYAANLHKDKK